MHFNICARRGGWADWLAVLAGWSGWLAQDRPKTERGNFDRSENLSHACAVVEAIWLAVLGWLAGLASWLRWLDWLAQNHPKTEAI